MIHNVENFDQLKLLFQKFRNEKNDRRKKIQLQNDGSYIVEIFEDYDPNWQQKVKVPLLVKMNVVYGDTDSIMFRVQYNRNDKIKNRIDSFQIGEMFADNLTSQFNRKPIEMECENIYNPFALLMRKRYVGKKYEDPKNPNFSKSITTKGLATKRRDYPIYIQNVLKKIIEILVEEHSDYQILMDKCKQLYYSSLEQLKNFQVDFDDLVQSSLIKKNYKNENLAHVNLFKRMINRQEDVQIGDRLQYIFIESDSTSQKFELAENPQFAKENNLKPNRLIYSEKLGKVILGFFKNLFPDQIDEMLEKTNQYLISFNGKKLNKKDFEQDV